jgi:hypothetical protein
MAGTRSWRACNLADEVEFVPPKLGELAFTFDRELGKKLGDSKHCPALNKRASKGDLLPSSSS